MAITLGGNPFYHKAGVPIAYSLWVKQTTNADYQTIASQCDTSNTTNGWVFDLRPTAPGFINLQARDGSNTVIDAFAANSFADNNWHHLAINLRFTNASLSEVWVDGVRVINAACSAAWSPTGLVEYNVGKSPTNFAAWIPFTGSLADIAAFSQLLSADQIQALAKGFSAQRVLLSKIMLWIPLLRHTPGSNEEDDKTGIPHAGAAVLSNAGNESYIEHPRIYY